MSEGMSFGNEPIYENIPGANLTEDRQFDYIVQTNHIDDNDIEQRKLSEVRNEIRDSIVQEYRALSLDCMEEPDDMNDEEASTLIKSIKTWSQDNLDRLTDEEESDGEINDKIFARRQSISANGRVVVNSTKHVDNIWNSNASNSAEEVLDSEIFGYSNCDDYLVEAYNPIYGKGILFKVWLQSEMIDIPYIDENDVPFTIPPQPDKLCDQNVLRDSGIEENFKFANEATNKTEDIDNNAFCEAFLDAITSRDTQLTVTRNPIDTYSGYDKHIYEDVVGGAYLDENKNDNKGNDLANDATNKTEDIYNKAFCEAFLDVIISSDTPLTVTPNPICDENVYDTLEYDYENAVGGPYLDENQNDSSDIYCTLNFEEENHSSLQIPAPPNTQLWSPKLQLAIQELIDTEKTYIGSMEFFIEQYVKYFLNDPKKRLELPGIRVIFGNIENLYEGSKNILEKLEKCNLSVDCIANVFLQSKPLFKLYADYLRNKARKKATLESMYKKHLKQRQEKLKDKNTWDSYLLAPEQRLLSYKILLGELQNELTKLDKENKNLEAAISFVDQNNRQIDTLLAIDSIYDCPIDLENIGGMHLLKDKFNIKRKYKSVVFLFEGAIVFTTKNKLQKEVYDCKDSININALAFQNRSKSSFIVSNCSETKLSDSHSFEMEHSSQAVCETWVKQIRYILRNQNK